MHALSRRVLLVDAVVAVTLFGLGVLGVELVRGIPQVTVPGALRFLPPGCSPL